MTSSITPSTERRDPVPIAVQISAWILGLSACVAGMLNYIAEWSPELASLQFLLLAIAPIPFMLHRRKIPRVEISAAQRRCGPVDWGLSAGVGCLALWNAAAIGQRIGDLPPAYHDEYSYVFQAKTLLAGQFSFPGSTVQPELFDQMHILNEGRMASRYYPGTGLWLAPFVAMDHPYWGQWCAGAMAAVLIYWVGFELSGRLAALTASISMAVSPGIGLFGNMLLAHHPCLLALCIFLLGIIRWRRTRSGLDAWIAGCGLSFAMLCRPMTAAAFGFPFGLDAVAWLISAKSNPEPSVDGKSAGWTNSRLLSLLGLGLPLLAGWMLMAYYNHSVTGDWLKSPYQLYTDTYTPRHVYGFNNVLRGEQRLGPRVIEYYDRWAQNLTPKLAAENLLNRWVCSWLWTFDLLPLLMVTVVALGTIRRWDIRWRLVGVSIVCLHAFHLPYWYVGIMGWHYVFETAPLWLLLLAGTTAALFSSWRQSGKTGMPIWWLIFLMASAVGVYLVPGEKNRSGDRPPSRFIAGVNSLAYPRRQHAKYRRWINEHVDQRPALVLLDQESTESSHLDLVVNNPGLTDDIILGRLRAGTHIAKVKNDFPDRHLYIATPERQMIRRVE